MSGGPNTLQFLYELIFTGVGAFESAAGAFRMVENEATQVLLGGLNDIKEFVDILPKDAIRPADNVIAGLETFIRDASYIASFRWFTRVLADVFLMILVGLGTFLVLYLLG